MSRTTRLHRWLAKPYRTVGPTQAAALIKDGAVLLDVREPVEWHAGHAPAARHIPLAQLTRRAHELPARRPIVTVCRSGRRSARAAALLAGTGRDVADLAGGMRAWAHAALPVLANGGRPGHIT